MSVGCGGFAGDAVSDRRYNGSRKMTILRGHVEGGRVVIDEEGELPEGAQVEISVLIAEDEMTPEERAELLASIDRGLEQASRGETVPAEEVLRRLRSLG